MKNLYIIDFLPFYVKIKLRKENTQKSINSE